MSKPRKKKEEPPPPPTLAELKANLETYIKIILDEIRRPEFDAGFTEQIALELQDDIARIMPDNAPETCQA